MNSRNSPCDDLLAFSRDAGIDAIAITPAGPVDSETIARYNGWIGNGYNAGMDYLNRYPEIRFNPEGLLPGAQSIVCCAVSYNHADSQPQGAPKITSYAHVPAQSPSTLLHWRLCRLSESVDHVSELIYIEEQNHRFRNWPLSFHPTLSRCHYVPLHTHPPPAAMPLP